MIGLTLRCADGNVCVFAASKIRIVKQGDKADMEVVMPSGEPYRYTIVKPGASVADVPKHKLVVGGKIAPPGLTIAHISDYLDW